MSSISKRLKNTLCLVDVYQHYSPRYKVGRYYAHKSSNAYHSDVDLVVENDRDSDTTVLYTVARFAQLSDARKFAKMKNAEPVFEKQG